MNDARDYVKAGTMDWKKSAKWAAAVWLTAVAVNEARLRRSARGEMTMDTWRQQVAANPDSIWNDEAMARLIRSPVAGSGPPPSENLAARKGEYVGTNTAGEDLHIGDGIVYGHWKGMLLEPVGGGRVKVILINAGGHARLPYGSPDSRVVFLADLRRA